jgi:hypothetical protein
MGAASMATPAAANPSPSSFSTISPPNEWPMTIGRAGRLAIALA